MSAVPGEYRSRSFLSTGGLFGFVSVKPSTILENRDVAEDKDNWKVASNMLVCSPNRSACKKLNSVCGVGFVAYAMP